MFALVVPDGLQEVRVSICPMPVTLEPFCTKLTRMLDGPYLEGFVSEVASNLHWPPMNGTVVLSSADEGTVASISKKNTMHFIYRHLYGCQFGNTDRQGAPCQATTTEWIEESAS